MTTPLHDLELKFAYAVSRSIRPEGSTVHYGGDSPHARAVNRSTPELFRDSVPHGNCAGIVRAWHSFHRRSKALGGRGWAGFAYNSAVCPHGHRYEGRGRGRRSGANGTNSGNFRSYAIVYIAGGNDPLTEEAKAAFLDEQDRLGVPLKWNHSDWKSTSCAGDPMRQWQRSGFHPPNLSIASMEKVKPMFDPPLILEPIVDALVDPVTGGLWQLGRNGGVYAWAGARYGPDVVESMVGKSYWLDRKAAHFAAWNDVTRTIVPRDEFGRPVGEYHRPLIVSSAGEEYGHSGY